MKISDTNLFVPSSGISHPETAIPPGVLAFQDFFIGKGS